MPFIPQNQRRIINPTLDMAMKKIQNDLYGGGITSHKAGILAYIVYRTMLHFVRSGTWADLSRVWADVVLGAGAYFKREEIDPYEDHKKAENGEIIRLEKEAT